MKKVFINGTFDILHPGHIELFRYAKYLYLEDTKLIVAIDTDERVKQLKGKTRPIHTVNDRVKVLEAIKYIDEVLTFNSDVGLANLIRYLKPDAMVKGSDYRNKPIIGAEYCKEILFVDRTDDSTTKIIERISNR